MVKSKSKSNPYKGAFYVVAVALVVTVLLVAVQGGGLTGAAAVLLDPSNQNGPVVEGKWINMLDGLNGGGGTVNIPGQLVVGTEGKTIEGLKVNGAITVLGGAQHYINGIRGLNSGKAEVHIPTLKVDSMSSLKIGDKTLEQLCK